MYEKKDPENVCEVQAIVSMRVKILVLCLLLAASVSVCLPESCSSLQHRQGRRIMVRWPPVLILRGGGPWGMIRQTALDAASVILTRMSTGSGNQSQADEIENGKQEDAVQDRPYNSWERWGVRWTGKRSRFEYEDESKPEASGKVEWVTAQVAKEKSPPRESPPLPPPPPAPAPAPPAVRMGVDYSKFDRIQVEESAGSDDDDDDQSDHVPKEVQWEPGEKMGEVDVYDEWDPYMPTTDAEERAAASAAAAKNEEDDENGAGNLLVNKSPSTGIPRFARETSNPANAAKELAMARLRMVKVKKEPQHLRFSDADTCDGDGEQQNDDAMQGEKDDDASEV